MCTNISYTHYCNGYKVVATDKRSVCPYCKVSVSALVKAGRAAPTRAPSTGWGGVTGRAFVQPAGSQGRS